MTVVQYCILIERGRVLLPNYYSQGVRSVRFDVSGNVVQMCLIFNDDIKRVEAHKFYSMMRMNELKFAVKNQSRT